MEIRIRHELTLGLMLWHAMADALLRVLYLLSRRDYVAEFAGGLNVRLELVCDNHFGFIG